MIFDYALKMTTAQSMVILQSSQGGEGAGIIGQIITVAFALCMLYITYLHFRRNDYSKGIALLWMGLWVGLGILALFARHVSNLVETLQFARLMDLIMVAGLAVFALVTFLNFAALSRLERKLEQFVRKSALSDLDVEDKPEQKENETD